MTVAAGLRVCPGNLRGILGHHDQSVGLGEVCPEDGAANGVGFHRLVLAHPHVPHPHCAVHAPAA